MKTKTPKGQSPIVVSPQTTMPPLVAQASDAPEESSKQLFDRVKRQVDQAFKRQQRQVAAKQKKALALRLLLPGDASVECGSVDR